MRFGLAASIGCCLAILLAGCGATRKVSDIDLREPASVVLPSVPLSQKRQRFTAIAQIPSACSAEIRQDLLPLISRRLELGSCPADLPILSQSLNGRLLLEERSLLESLVSSGCQGLVKADLAEQVQSFVENFHKDGPLGRHKAGRITASENAGEYENLVKLHDILQSVLSSNVPLEQWQERYGEFVVPEQSLDFLWHLVTEASCSSENENFDQAYYRIQAMEDLERLLPENEQRAQLRRALAGLYTILDERVSEFFKPRGKK